MRKPIPLNSAVYKSGLLVTLLVVVMEKSEECSAELQDLIAIAADLSQEINLSLSAGVVK